MMRLVVVVAFSLALLAPLSSEGQAEDKIVTDLAKAQLLISGPREKVWIEETVIAALSGNSCEKGVRYRFAADRTVSKESCINASWIVEKGTWSLSQNEDELFVLTLWEKDFIATLVRKPDTLELAILDLPDVKVSETTEILLRYVED